MRFPGRPCPGARIGETQPTAETCKTLITGNFFDSWSRDRPFAADPGIAPGPHRRKRVAHGSARPFNTAHCPFPAPALGCANVKHSASIR